jgi:hypothetical protein
MPSAGLETSAIKVAGLFVFNASNLTPTLSNQDEERVLQVIAVFIVFASVLTSIG